MLRVKKASAGDRAECLGPMVKIGRRCESVWFWARGSRV